MVKSNWSAPPKYKTAHDNKRAIRDLSQMSYGLEALATATQSGVAKRLANVGTSLAIKASSAGHRAYLKANVEKLFYDLVNLRSTLCDGGNDFETESYLRSLEADVKELGTFLEHDIADSPLESHVSRPIRKFIANKSAVESVARATESSLASANEKLKRLLSVEPRDEREKHRIAQQIANIRSSVKSLEKAADAFCSIVDLLNELEDASKRSHGLERRVNRIVNLKRIADFYDKPAHSAKEREKLYLQLYRLAHNATDADEDMTMIQAALNGTVTPDPLTVTPLDGSDGVRLNEPAREQRQTQSQSQTKKLIHTEVK